MRFQDKVAFLTGAASGIGLATARRFAAEGARVVLVDVDIAGARRAAATRRRRVSRRRPRNSLN